MGKGGRQCHCDDKGEEFLWPVAAGDGQPALAVSSQRKYGILSRSILSIFVTVIYKLTSTLQIQWFCFLYKMLQNREVKVFCRSLVCFWPVKFWRGKPVSAVHSGGDPWVTVQSLYCIMLLVQQPAASQIYVCILDFCLSVHHQLRKII